MLTRFYYTQLHLSLRAYCVGNCSVRSLISSISLTLCGKWSQVFLSLCIEEELRALVIWNTVTKLPNSRQCLVTSIKC